ncbi:MAG: tetratricopeptide repeat protein, partial [Candidatus Sulfotelmatobacter sp.]
MLGNNSESSEFNRSAADESQPRALPDQFTLILRAAYFVLLLATSFCPSAWSQTGDFASLASSADAARQQGDIPMAIELYRKATEENPNWPDGWWFLGILQYDGNQYAGAKEALSRYLQLTPNAAPALALRGLCEFEMSDYPESLQDLDLAASRGAANQPRNARIILYHQALLLIHFGRFEESLAKFALLAKQGSDNQDLPIGIGLAGLRINLLPKDVPAAQIPKLSAIGNAALRVMNEDYDAGRQAFQSLFTQYPQVANIHYLYGYLLFATRPEQALSQFREELAISPHSPHAHAMCAWALELQGDYAAAVEDAAKAATEDPSLPMGQLVYGRALVETGDIIGALPHLENVLRSEPGNLEAHLAIV